MLALAAPAQAGARPSLRIDSKPSRFTKHTTVRFRFSSKAEHASFGCRLSSRGHRSHFRRCRSGWRRRRLHNRTYVFSVFARGANGGKRSRVLRRRFTVDTVRPRVRIRSGPGLESGSSAATFAFFASDRSRVRLRCQTGGGASARCRSPLTLTGLADGDHSFQVRGTDAAGNRSAMATYGWNIYTGPPRPRFSTTPGLVGGFGWEKRDNVVRCDNKPVAVNMAAPHGWSASVAGSAFRQGRYTVSVPLTRNHRFAVTFHNRAGGPDQVFNVRCLPTDFAPYEFTRSRSGGPDFFLIEHSSHYVAIFDRNGVPVWWAQTGGVAHNFELLPDGTVAWDSVPNATDQTGSYEVRDLQNHLIRSVNTVGATTDIHELLRLNNGNYLLAGQTSEPGTDLTSIGGPMSATVIGFKMQEITPAGGLASSWWQTQGHISPSETTPRWRSQPVTPAGSHDTQHWNSIQPTDNNTKMLLSFRHFDAVYMVDRGTQDVEWKLGGTTTPQSLTVLGDPQGSDPFAGQHDARLLSDGTLTVFDDGTFAGRPPRVVRYQIDPVAHTARLIEAFRDPLVPAAFCCGSARRLSDSWLVGWGGAFNNSYVGAYDFNGQPIWRLKTNGPDFSYRANPVPPGALSEPQLQAAMDAMNP